MTTWCDYAHAYRHPLLACIKSIDTCKKGFFVYTYCRLYVLILSTMYSIYLDSPNDIWYLELSIVCAVDAKQLCPGGHVKSEYKISPFWVLILAVIIVWGGILFETIVTPTKVMSTDTDIRRYEVMSIRRVVNVTEFVYIFKLKDLTTGLCHTTFYLLTSNTQVTLDNVPCD